MQYSNLKELQLIVDDTVRTLGGYWMPLSGLARVLEELGELGTLILEKNYHEEFASELSDVMIITLCVANQYCAQLDKPEDGMPMQRSGLSLIEWYVKLVVDCGELARIINSYEGNKKLKPKEHPTTIEKQSSVICSDIISIASIFNLSISEVVKRTLDKVRRRDKHRFETLYDPSLSFSHDKYVRTVSSSRKVWGLRDSSHHSLDADLLNNTDTITRFLKFGEIEGIEGLVVKIPDKKYSIKKLGIYDDVLTATQQNDFVFLSKR